MCKAHDRCAFIEVKNFMGKNPGETDKAKKRVSITNEDDNFSMGVETKWDNPNTMWECVDSFLRCMAVVHLVNQHSYAGLAIFHCIHSCRWAVPCKQR